METQENRRPLAVRDHPASKAFACWLAQKNITPNQISIVSVFFAIFASLCFFAMRNSQGISQWLLPLLAGTFIQCRLLCNLFDGMVAIEGGKKTLSGELFNDIPDRIADPIILVAAGYASIAVPFSDALGWCAGLLAVLTAYIRTLSASIGAPVDFVGPMAKQHRMAVMTFACVAASIQALLGHANISLPLALSIIILGCLITVCRRTLRAYRFLEGQHHV